MSQEQHRLERVHRLRLGTLLFLAIVGFGGLLAWKLVEDEAGKAAPKHEPATRQSRYVAFAPESLPTSMPAIGGKQEALALAPVPGAIRGKVIDRGEIPVNHGTVRFVLKVPPGQRNFALVAKFDETTKVDDDGKFSYVVPGGGTYQVIAEAEGFAPAIKDGVKPGDEIELMLDVGASLTGSVTDKITGKPVEAANVEVSVEKGAMVKKLVTNQAGEFALKDLPAAKLMINVEHPLYVPRNGVDQTVQAGEAATIKIELDPGKSIKGQVLAAEDGRQIEGAIITIRKKKATTDPTGRFVVKGLESEMHDIQTAADGFQADQRQINLSGSRVEAVAEIQLNRGATIRGRVQNEKAEPVAGAELKLFETWENWSYEDWMTRHLNIKTAEDGAFKMTGIPAREWMNISIRVRSKGYPETFEKGIKITRNDDDIFVPITIRQGAVIAGRVFDQENRPVSGARIELRTQNSGGWWIPGGEEQGLNVTGTSAEGEFRFEALGFSMYTLSVHVRGFSSAWKNDLDLTSGASLTNVLLTVESGSPLKGIVLDPEEKPIAGANVNIWTQKGNGQAVSDPEGKFVVESLPKGPYDVYAWAAGFGNTRLSKQLPAGDVGLRIVLKREAVLKGTVVDAQTKKPIQQFRAFLINEDNRQGWRQPRWGNTEGDPDGKFQIQAPQGTYRLEVMSTGYVRAKKESITLQPGTDPEPVKIEMKRGGAIEGTIRAENGQPQPWIQVYVGKDDGSNVLTGACSSENDGYFFVGDLDSGGYIVVFQTGDAPLLLQSGVYVGGEKPAFVDAQIERVAWVGFDFTMERPKAQEEVTAGATSESPPPPPSQAPAPPAKPFRPPRVRAWIESLDGTPLGINHEWNGPEPKYKLITRKDIYCPNRQERFSLGANDLPAGRFVLRASARGYVDARVPFQVQQGARWRMPVEMKLLPKELRPEMPEGPRLRIGYWFDNDGNRHEYRYYEDE